MSTSWYAPNQQAVRADGSGPAEEGTGGSSASPKQPPATAPMPAATSEDLDAMTKDELIDYAEQRGITVDASMTKAQIREAIGA